MCRSLPLIVFTMAVASHCRPNGDFRPYASTGTRNDGYHDWNSDKAGLLSVGQGDDDAPFQVKFLEGKVEGNNRGYRTWGPSVAGKAEVSAIHARFGNSKHNLDAKFMTAGVDATAGVLCDTGAVVRAALFDHTIHTGPLAINYGVVADTGIKFHKGLEAKMLGVGGYVGVNGVQACFIVCLGINWG